jgi:hypothetical protein
VREARRNVEPVVVVALDVPGELGGRAVRTTRVRYGDFGRSECENEAQDLKSEANETHSR